MTNPGSQDQTRAEIWDVIWKVIVQMQAEMNQESSTEQIVN